MARSKRHRDHGQPHRAWNFLYKDGELTQLEHDHILACELCLKVFQLCLKSESFGVVLKDLGEDADVQQSA